MVLKDIHHLHKRKRIKLKTYPNKSRPIKFLDDLLLLIAIIGPFVNFPQIFKIYHLKNATGVSLISWSLFALFDIPWVIYGYVHKEKLLIIAYSLWFISNIIIIIGIILYG